MDGDNFSHATRLGLNAAHAVLDAARGARFDPFSAERLLDALIERAGGIPSLRVTLTGLADLRSPALLIPPDVEEICTRMERAAHEPNCSQLDLVLQQVAKSAIRRGEMDATAILERFVETVIDRYVITARGGLIEIDGPHNTQRARVLMAPVVRDAASELFRRPDLSRLGLARRSRVTADSDLRADTS